MKQVDNAVASAHGGVVDFHGAVLVARRDERLPSDASDLSNVVPFARPRRQGAAPDVLLPSVAAGDRPTPTPRQSGIAKQIAVLAGSLVLHGGLLALFWRDPPPLASIGIEAITVEIVLGAHTAAGVAPTPGEQEVQATALAEERAPEEPVPEQSRMATLMPQEVPVAAQEAAPETKPQEQPPEVPTVEATLQEQPPQPDTIVSEISAEVQPVERPSEPTARPPQVPAVQTSPERKRIDAPTQKQIEEKKQPAAATAPTDAASGVGRGASQNAANYDGRVSAHLARHKQYPAAARGSGAQGVARISFSIDGDGRVTSVRLLAGSGNADIDQEAVAMVRRASPFPRPPGGQGRNFTVPVRFNLR